MFCEQNTCNGLLISNFKSLFIKIMKSFNVTYYFCSFLDCVCGLIECKSYTENHVYCQKIASLVMLVKFHHDKKSILITRRETWTYSYFHGDIKAYKKSSSFVAVKCWLNSFIKTRNAKTVTFCCAVVKYTNIFVALDFLYHRLD